jgi:hypothetical protein
MAFNIDKNSGRVKVRGFSSVRFSEDMIDVLVTEAVRQYGYTVDMVFAFSAKAVMLDGFFTGLGKRNWIAARKERAANLRGAIEKAEQGRLAL